MKAAKVGDYVHALLVTSVPRLECDADLTREGVVTEIRNGNDELVLSSSLGNEFVCFAQGAVVIDDDSLSLALQQFVMGKRLSLNA